MAKAASPVRLQQELMEKATLAGARQHRSAAEQIEYWAALGRQMAGVVDPDTLLDVLSGLATLKVVPVAGVAVEVDAVEACGCAVGGDEGAAATCVAGEEGANDCLDGMESGPGSAARDSAGAGFGE